MKALPKKLGFRLFVILAVLMLFGLGQLGFVNANPSLPPDIPPIVAVSTININASIYRQDNQLWASIDAEYVTCTIHGFGDSYYLPKEHIYPSDNSTYKLTVVTDMLEADYPIPLNTTNISVKVNGDEQEWYLKEQSIYHLYGSDMKRIGWVMQPAPRDFTVTVHYEHPLLITGDTEQALILPLGQRYGSTEAPYYPLYDWYGNADPVVTLNLQTDGGQQVQAYSVYSDGKMSQLAIESSALATTKVFTVTRNDQNIFPLGVVFLQLTSEYAVLSTVLFVLIPVIVGITLTMFYCHRRAHRNYCGKSW